MAVSQDECQTECGTEGPGRVGSEVSDADVDAGR